VSTIPHAPATGTVPVVLCCVLGLVASLTIGGLAAIAGSQ